MTRKLLMMGVVVLLAAPVYATLIDRGNGLIYDDVLDITWLQDANFCGTNPGDPGCIAATAGAGLFPGQMLWDNAVAWADNLMFGGFDDWRLPAISRAGGLPTGSSISPVYCNSATEMECRDNELGYMFYHNLGGRLGDNRIGNQMSGSVTIQNVPHDTWSGTEFPSISVCPSGLSCIWGFDFGFGDQYPVDKDSLSWGGAAWAVRPGDVLAAAPEPSILFLFGTGLIGLVGYARHCRR